MGQARKVVKKKKETKEDVLKKEITAAVNKRATAKINEVKALVESVQEQVDNHFKHHEEGGDHAHSDIENRVNDLERRLLDMIDDLRHEVNKLRSDRVSTGGDPQPPSAF